MIFKDKQQKINNALHGGMLALKQAIVFFSSYEFVLVEKTVFN